MAKKKTVPKPRDPNAKALESPIFHKKVIPVKRKEPPKVEDYD
jgi:hypothetical protein